MNTKTRRGQCLHRPATRIVSLILSLAMLLTLTAGMGLNVNASDRIKSINYNSVEPFVNVEYAYGDWKFDENGEKYYHYIQPDFHLGDIIVINYYDGTKEIYTYTDYNDYYFRNNNGNYLPIEYFDTQASNHWYVGSDNYFVLKIDSYELQIPIQIIESSYEGIEIVLQKPIEIKEHTNGNWFTDGNGEEYYDYFVDFNPGDLLIIKKKDGTSDRLSYRLFYHEDIGMFIGNFVDKNGLTPEYIDYYFSNDNQEDEHWTVGNTYQYEYGVEIEGVDFFASVDVKIVENIKDDVNDLVPKRFNDLNGFEYYNNYVAYTSIYNSYIAGTNPPYYTAFSPVRAINRAMLITILHRMAGSPYDGANNPYPKKGINPFTDVDEDAYYYNAACWALKNGITTETTFKPFDNVTREQTASFLFRYAKDNGTVGDEAYKNVNLSSYPDYNSVHSWATEAMQWANYNGMITGTQQGYINPQGATQRIHATKILYGFGKVCNIGNFE